MARWWSTITFKQINVYADWKRQIGNQWVSIHVWVAVRAALFTGHPFTGAKPKTILLAGSRWKWSKSWMIFDCLWLEPEVLLPAVSRCWAISAAAFGAVSMNAVHQSVEILRLPGKTIRPIPVATRPVWLGECNRWCRISSSIRRTFPKPLRSGFKTPIKCAFWRIWFSLQFVTHCYAPEKHSYFILIIFLPSMASKFHFQILNRCFTTKEESW